MSSFNDSLMGGFNSAEEALDQQADEIYHGDTDNGSVDAAPDFILADADISGEVAEDATVALLGRIGDMMNKQLVAESEVEKAEATLKSAKDALRQIQEVDLPTLVRDELGIERIDVADTAGNIRTVEVKEKLAMSIPKKNSRECASWLINHELGPLVSETIVMSFNPDEKETAELVRNQLHVIERLEDITLDPVTSVGMNTTSVKAALANLREKGEDVPLEMFGGHVIRQAKIK